MCQSYEIGQAFVTQLRKKECILLKPDGKSPYEITFKPGIYKIELWGASGGTSHKYTENYGGRGGYVAGELKLKSSNKFFIYVGTQGGNTSANNVPGKGGFIGGVDGAKDNVDYNAQSAGSGGATDMRLEENLPISRILVAGGGGAPGANTFIGGDAGGTEGAQGENGGSGGYGGSGGTQVSGNFTGQGQAPEEANEAPGGGGGGYFGGFAGLLPGKRPLDSKPGGAGGGGGSSFISGYSECIAYNKDGSQRDNSIHYSGFSFEYPLMLYGDTVIPSPYSLNESYQNGYKGDGAARITFLSSIQHATCNRNHISLSSIFFLLFLAK